MNMHFESYGKGQRTKPEPRPINYSQNTMEHSIRFTKKKEIDKACLDSQRPLQSHSLGGCSRTEMHDCPSRSVTIGSPNQTNLQAPATWAPGKEGGFSSFFSTTYGLGLKSRGSGFEQTSEATTYVFP